ncbi:MAG: hypothetical protein DRP59_12375 [Spirochaetes bacterium]|nr:MAG: hypothetical protein DRP59_12375 [Spirochaetota bacterium]
MGLVESLKLTLQNKWFVRYVIGTILYWFAFNMIRAVIAYYPVVLTGPVGALFLLAGFFVFLKYPQNEISSGLELYRKKVLDKDGN